MKFGKILEERRHPNWRCISYETLKKKIKTSDYTEESVRSFFDAIVHEIEEVDTFFQKIQAAFEKKDENVTAATLRSHAVLNYLAVLKILKKHDKRMQRSVEERGEMVSIQTPASESPKQALFKTSFCTSISAGSASFCQDMSPEERRGHRRRRRASSSTNPCPVCFEDLIDPAVLPCKHRFCWTCLANCATQGIKCCPLCRKEQSLEPVNLEIQTILGCTGHQYYPTNQNELNRSNSPTFSDALTNSNSEDQCSADPEELDECSKGQSQQTPLSPPTTPPAASRTLDEPPLAPCRKPAPPLMKALNSGSMKEVEAALNEDAEAAELPFFDHNFEPPLCYAARVGVKKEIIEQLLQKGASVHAVDSSGQTPLEILSSVTSTPPFLLGVGIDAKSRACEVAKLLLDAKADVQCSHGTSCVELARAAGNDHLVAVFETSMMQALPRTFLNPAVPAIPICLPGGRVWLIPPR